MTAVGYSYQMAPPGTHQHSSIDPGRLRSMLQALDHTRLVDLVADLVAQQPSVYDHLKSVLRSDPTQRRLFVRGLSRECTNQDLIAVFSVFGHVDEAVVMKEKGTQCCKGFGFVTFADADAAEAALLQPEKLIAGRMAVVALAALRNKNKPEPPPATFYDPASYASRQSAANAGGYSRPHSGNPHKRYRERSPGQSPPYYESYKSPPSQYPCTNNQYHSSQSYYPLQRNDSHLYRLQEPSYSDHMTPYSTHMRY